MGGAAAKEAKECATDEHSNEITGPATVPPTIFYVGGVATLVRAKPDEDVVVLPQQGKAAEALAKPDSCAISVRRAATADLMCPDERVFFVKPG